jgi:hypothetical protein
MPPRPIDLRDLPTLYRHRGEALSLDTARLLTRGNPLGAAGLAAYFNPIRHVYSAIDADGEMSLVGGIIHTGSDSIARLFYLAPAGNLTHPSLPPLIEHLTAQAGAWGAFHVTAEVEEDSPVFAALRLAGYSVYASQRVWDLSHLAPQASQFNWQRMQEGNLPAIQSLYHQIVPPLLQPIQPVPKRTEGYICHDGAKCYVNLFYGMYGIFATPLIHPEAENVSEKLASLLTNLPNRRNRPIYLSVRSYQTWLEPALEDLGAQAAARQAVMVKHLAHLLKNAQKQPVQQPAGVVTASQVQKNLFRKRT